MRRTIAVALGTALTVFGPQLGAIPAIGAGEVSAAGTTTGAAYTPVTSAAAGTASQRRP